MENKGEKDGDSVISTIENWDISKQGSYIQIPNAANIINFKPETIIVEGNSVVGNNDDFSTFNVIDSIYMQSNFLLSIPFVFKGKT